MLFDVNLLNELEKRDPGGTGPLLDRVRRAFPNERILVADFVMPSQIVVVDRVFELGETEDERALIEVMDDTIGITPSALHELDGAPALEREVDELTASRSWMPDPE